MGAPAPALPEPSALYHGAWQTGRALRNRSGQEGSSGGRGVRVVELWFTETETPSVQMRFKVREVLYRQRSAYQDIVVLEFEDLGRALVLDGAIQFTEADGFVYHEMLAHVPLCAHPNPSRVLIVGGGDLGLLAEVLKHPEVQQVDLVEIDAQVVEVCQRFWPHARQAAQDPRVRLVVADASVHVKAVREAYDVVLVDAPDPGGPAIPLFSEGFYRDLKEVLRPEGLLAAQSGGLWFQRELTAQLVRHAAAIFPKAAVYLASVPSYSIGPWTFLAASKGPDPATPHGQRAAQLKTRYYTAAIHRAAFALPASVAVELGFAPRAE